MKKPSNTPLWFYGLVISSFIISSICLIMKWQNLLELLIVNALIQFNFSVIAINSVRQSTEISNKEKRSWYIMLFLFPLISGYFYLQKFVLSKARY